MRFHFRDSLRRFVWLAGLPFYGLWLLLLCCFEDTSLWAQERLILLKRTFATVTIILMGVSLFFCGKALTYQGDSGYYERRMDRLESRIDYQVDKAQAEHRELFQRVGKLETETKHMDRLVYGVIGLTVAVLGQWLLQLFKLRIERTE